MKATERARNVLRRFRAVDRKSGLAYANSVSNCAKNLPSQINYVPSGQGARQRDFEARVVFFATEKGMEPMAQLANGSVNGVLVYL